MRADILIVGQGLAGTILAWEFERAGVSFEMADGGHAHATTSAAAGIINPITGRRLVKSWRVEALLPTARALYRNLETILGVPLWSEMRGRRLFADERERVTFAQKEATGELAPFGEKADAGEFWINQAARVDLRTLLSASREHWLKRGRLRADLADIQRELAHHDLVIDCTGTAGARDGRFAFVPWEYSKGELLEVAVAGLDPHVILNAGHWVLPVAPDVAWIGATHEPGVIDSTPTAAGRVALETSARRLLRGRAFTISGQRAGVRVNLPDKRPIAGRHPERSQLGLVNGLGAKGALWAPMLARQWVNHLTEGVAFDPEVDVRRFVQ